MSDNPMQSKFAQFLEEEEESSLFPIIQNNSQIDANEIVDILKTVFDPEINYSIYDLGLIYGITIQEENHTIHILMTLTSANCPEAQSLPEEVKNRIEEEFSDYTISVEITFEPLWTVDNMTEEVKLGLGLL